MLPRIFARVKLTGAMFSMSVERHIQRTKNVTNHTKLKYIEFGYKMY